MTDEGSAADRLVGAFSHLIAEGVLGDGRGLKVNQATVFEGFEAAGVEPTTSVWSWINSD